MSRVAHLIKVYETKDQKNKRRIITERTTILGDCGGSISFPETDDLSDIARKSQKKHAGISSKKLSNYLMNHLTEMTKKGGEKSTLENKPQESSDQGSDEKKPKDFKDENKENDEKRVIRRKPKRKIKNHFHSSKLKMIMKKNKHYLLLMFFCIITDCLSHDDLMEIRSLSKSTCSLMMIKHSGKHLPLSC